MNTAKAYTYRNEKTIQLHTYEQWERIHSRKQARKRAKRNKALLKMLCKISGITMITLGLAIPFTWKTATIMSLITALSWVVTACIISVIILGLVGIGLYQLFK